jgi:hypothetical protein
MSERETFLPETGERALIVGGTGSGKTAFATWVIRRLPDTPVIIFDTKDEEKFPRLPNSIIVSTKEEILEQSENVEIDYIIVRPPIHLLNDPVALDDYLLFIYMHIRNVVVFIDEGYTFHTNGREHRGLVALYTRGRSKGITTIMCSQRPVRISRFCISESQKVYVFRLMDRRDRKTLSEVIPNYDDFPNPQKHWFYYFEAGNDEPELFRPVKLDAGMDTGYTDAASGEEKDQENASILDNPEPGTKHVWV